MEFSVNLAYPSLLNVMSLEAAISNIVSNTEATPHISALSIFNISYLESSTGVILGQRFFIISK